MKYAETLKSLSDTELVAIAEELSNPSTPYEVIESQLKEKSNSEIVNGEPSWILKDYVIDELSSRLLEKNVLLGDKTKKVGVFKKMFKRYLVG
jgi:hypothetical protein